MQHFGWLETYIDAALPAAPPGLSQPGIQRRRDQRVSRSLQPHAVDGFWLAGSMAGRRRANSAAAEAQQRRSRQCESVQLTNTRADVIFVFYGYNESFAGSAGLDKFKSDLDHFIKHTLAHRYNGKSSPRLVLFSPIAHENLRRSRTCRTAWRTTVAWNSTRTRWPKWLAHNGVFFVDLFTPSRQFFARIAAPGPVDDQRNPPEEAGGPGGGRLCLRGALRRTAGV